MRKILMLIAASLMAASTPALAQSRLHRDESAMQDIGGHFRYMHRDWSVQKGRHVNSICWDWDPGEGWVWNCDE